MNRQYAVSAEQVHHNNKNRNFLRIALFLIGVIILLASIFLLTIIYRTLKSGLQSFFFINKSNKFE
jgi:hypothetical protein